MKKTILIAFLACTCMLYSQISAAQHGKLDSLFAKGDTTAVMDSLMQGFDAFLDSLVQPKSFFSISAGMGNRTFSIKNNSLNTQESTTRQLSFTPTVAYYHKSGLGISATGFMTSLGGAMRFYQYAVTPSYDYISRHFVAGISYSRYFQKDTATLHSSPYDNDFYAYFNIHQKHWRYGLSAGYATGNFQDKLSYQDSVYRYVALLQRYQWVYFTKTVESSNHIKDLSLSASLRRDFSWDAVFNKRDHITAGLTAYLVAGSSRIKTNSSTSYGIRKLTLAKFRRSYENADGNKFQLQSAALSASVYYTIGQFSVMPVWFMDYYFQDADRKISQVFSVSVAYNF